jgi:hypothetical protein
VNYCGAGLALAYQCAIARVSVRARRHEFFDAAKLDAAVKS